MIHEWFMHFGAIAAVLALVSFFAVRGLVKLHPAQNSDDRQGNAFGAVFFGIVTVIVLGVALLLVCFGISATYVGWAGMVLGGVTFGLATGTD